MNIQDKQRLMAQKLLQKHSKKMSLQIPKRQPEIKLALSAAQMRLWLLNKMEPNNSTYNLVSCFSLKGNLNIKAMRLALDSLEKRHEMLRTVFCIDEDGIPYQHIRSAQGAPFDIEDISTLGVDNNLIDDVINKRANILFDFEVGPLWNISLIKIRADEFILVINVHHIAFDGWSLGVFIRELFQYYKEAVLTGSVTPAELEIQYADYSEWNRHYLQHTGRAADQAEFWRDYLRTTPGVLALRHDFPRQHNTSSKGATKTLILPWELFDALCQLGRPKGITPFNIFMGIFKTLLYRYTGQQNIVVGTPVSGRSHQEFHPLIGILANTLPITNCIDPAESFLHMLERIAQGSLNAFNNADLTFDSIVEAVNPERSAGVNPIFQVFYAYQTKVDPGSVAGLDVLYQIRDFGTAKFDLSLDVMEGPEGPTCIFEYNTSLFLDETIERMMGHFHQLVKSVVENPQQTIGKINFLTEQERSNLASTIPIRHLPDEFDITFAQRFSQIAEQCSAATALVDGSKRLSYQQLAQAVDRVTCGLIEAGLSEAENIGLYLLRSWEIVVAILAINKLGCTFVALDPEQPAARLQHLIEDAQITRVICTSVQSNPLLDLGATQEMIAIESLLATPVGGTPIVLPEVSSLAKAYCVYTSGTTGKPKGVAVSHRNWMNALYGWQQHYELGVRIFNHLQMANIGFDVFCGDLIRALGTGGKLVLCKKEDFAQPEVLYQLMLTEQIEFAEFVPAVFRPFAEYLAQTQQPLSDIKLLVVASDSWYMSEYQRFLNLLPASAKLINSYGMVECTIDSTWFSNDQFNLVDMTTNDATVPVGFNFPNVDTYILSEQRQLQPVGIIGEICVGGLGVVEGYIGLDTLSKERFIPSPFVANEKIYCTGDLGYRRTDGSLVLLGRGDNQVKIRGQRVELAEIEACILRHQQVTKAVVLVQKDALNQATLVAYLVTREAFDLVELKGSLTQWLPSYMIPSHYLVLAELPLNQNGKVDRKALPAIDIGAAASNTEVKAPASPTELLLANIWRDIFKTTSIAIHCDSDFFVLGGHSLTAVQMVAKIRKAGWENVSVQDIFSCTKLAQLAERMDQLAEQATAEINNNPLQPDPAVLITPKPEQRFEPFPMTPIQQAYWLGRGDLFEFGNVSAHSYDEFDMEQLDPTRLELAWNKVIQQHDMLRTIVLPDGAMQVLPEVPFYTLRRADLSNLNEVDIAQSLEEVRGQMSHQIIDISVWPTFDVRLSLLPNARMRLHFSTDAIMFDVRSFLILLQDFVSFYVDEQKPIQLSEVTFRDYVIAEYQIVQNPENTKSRDYWKARIPSLPPAPQLPQAKNPSDVKKPHFTRLHNRWNKDTWSTLKKMAAMAGITPTGLLLAAYAETLAGFSREPAFSLNLTFLNRRPLHPAIDTVVGEFTSLTLLAIDNSAAQDFKSRARNIQADLWRDLEHNDVSGVDVLRELSKLSGDNYRARMPVVFTSALVMDVPEQIAGLDITPLHLNSITQTSQVWLDCGVWEESGELLCNWDVVKEMYPEGLIEQMFAEFTALVARLANSPDLWLATTTRNINDKTGLYPQVCIPEYIGQEEETLIKLFLDKVQQQPDHPAVVADNQRLSYLDLAQVSYGLAEKLVTADGSHKNLKNSLVAIAMHKGWESVAATLGIMIAGGAYLPIDPELPPERIQYLLKQCDVKYLITQPWLTSELPDLAGVKIIELNLDIKRELDTNLRLHLPEAEDLAYVIFTSGSTGTPKGVVIDQRGATNTILDCNRRYKITSDDAVLAISALNFDLSVYDIFGILAAGGLVVMPTYEKRIDPRHWLAQITAHKVTLWNSVPALLGLLINYCEQQQIHLHNLRQAWVSGDWVPLTLRDRLGSLNPEIKVTSMGGATEASIWSITYPIETVDASWQSIPYGKAMHNQQMYVLNHRLEICPNWVTGEIYIGGIGLAQGYWRDHEKTAAAFIHHPVTGARLYKTGDIGRYLGDGNIEFLGRADFQIKVQGYRIELGEIERALCSIKGVKDALVSAIGARHSDKTLVAYLIAQPDSSTPLDLTSIQNVLLQKLPEYMVPRRYFELQSFPLSANGKVDRKQLPIPSSMGSSARPEFCAAETELQQALVSIWQEILEVEVVGINDQFIHLGGNSIKAVTMLTMIQSRLNMEVSFRQIMTSKSIAELAESLTLSETQRNKVHRSQSKEIVSETIE